MMPLSSHHNVGLCNISKIYHRLSINIRNLNVAENCLSRSKLHSVCHPFLFCVTIYLANWMDGFQVAEKLHHHAIELVHCQYIILLRDWK